MNVALVRASSSRMRSVAAPRLALGRWLWWDACSGTLGSGWWACSSPSGRVAPRTYPLPLDVQRYIADEQRLAGSSTTR